jgi:aldehyde dehydrogenase (NAD+)
MKTFTHTFETDVFKGTVEVPLGHFIDGKFIEGSDGKTLRCASPCSIAPSLAVSLMTIADVVS